VRTDVYYEAGVPISEVGSMDEPKSPHVSIYIVEGKHKGWETELTPIDYWEAED
jgi:hypothetical protein